MAMRDLLGEGLLFFNASQFYEAHEAWEDLWRETADPSLKLLYQGLIQAAVGLHHLAHRNATGARSQLGKSIRNLRAGSGQTGLDIDGLVVQLSEVLENMPTEPSHPPRIARLK